MASFISSAGSKRVRPWDSCQDVEALKEMLEEREAEIESFKKQSPIMEEDIVKKLQASLQEKEGRIEELMRAVQKSNAVFAFGKVFAASSKMAPKDGCVDNKKAASASGNAFSSVEASKKMKCGIENCQVLMENACADAKKGVTRTASLQQSRCVAALSEEDMDCDKRLASDSTDDEDFTLKETASDDDDDDDDDDEEYTHTITSTKQMGVGASRGKAKKTNTNGHADSEGVFNGNVLNLRASIHKQIVSQMVYRRGLKHRTSKAVAEVPNLSEAHMKAILGDDLFAKASCKGKLIQVTASDDDIRALFRGSFTKSLRYGSSLVLSDGLKFVFTKATCVLKVTGVFTMY